jgi:hypothetical protein
MRILDLIRLAEAYQYADPEPTRMARPVTDKDGQKLVSGERWKALNKEAAE